LQKLGRSPAAAQWAIHDLVQQGKLEATEYEPPVGRVYSISGDGIASLARINHAENARLVKAHKAREREERIQAYAHFNVRPTKEFLGWRQTKRRKPAAAGDAPRRRKIGRPRSTEKDNEILEFVENGTTQSFAAEHFGVHPSTISKACARARIAREPVKKV
jgi:hypothetical protein